MRYIAMHSRLESARTVLYIVLLGVLILSVFHGVSGLAAS
jgi:hypothetical protein